MCVSKSKLPAVPEFNHSHWVTHLETKHPEAQLTPELRNSCVVLKVGSPRSPTNPRTKKLLCGAESGLTKGGIAQAHGVLQVQFANFRCQIGLKVLLKICKGHGSNSKEPKTSILKFKLKIKFPRIVAREI